MYELLAARKLSLFSFLPGSSFPRNPLVNKKWGFLEILFLGVRLNSHLKAPYMHNNYDEHMFCHIILVYIILVTLFLCTLFLRTCIDLLLSLLQV